MTKKCIKQLLCADKEFCLTSKLYNIVSGVFQTLQYRNIQPLDQALSKSFDRTELPKYFKKERVVLRRIKPLNFGKVPGKHDFSMSFPFVVLCKIFKSPRRYDEIFVKTRFS